MKRFHWHRSKTAWSLWKFCRLSPSYRLRAAPFFLHASITLPRSGNFVEIASDSGQGIFVIILFQTRWRLRHSTLEILWKSPSGFWARSGARSSSHDLLFVLFSTLLRLSRPQGAAQSGFSNFSVRTVCLFRLFQSHVCMVVDMLLWTVLALRKEAEPPDVDLWSSESA